MVRMVRPQAEMNVPADRACRICLLLLHCASSAKYLALGQGRMYTCKYRVYWQDRVYLRGRVYLQDRVYMQDSVYLRGQVCDL
jgi:hypothetical protein